MYLLATNIEDSSILRHIAGKCGTTALLRAVAHLDATVYACICLYGIIYVMRIYMYLVSLESL